MTHYSLSAKAIVPFRSSFSKDVRDSKRAKKVFSDVVKSNFVQGRRRNTQGSEVAEEEVLQHKRGDDGTGSCHLKGWQMD